MRPSRLSKCFAVFSHEPQNSTDQKVRSTHSSPPQEFSTTPMQYAECLADLDFGCGATTLSDHALRVTISTVRAHATPFFPALVPVATVSHAVPQVKLPTATLDHSLHTTRTVPGGTVHTPNHGAISASVVLCRAWPRWMHVCVRATPSPACN